MTESTPRYCYHCRRTHPENEMRLVPGRNGSRWRCLQTLKATSLSREQREAFGRQTSAINRAESQRKIESLNNYLRYRETA
jgi:hypothetical protein